MRFRSYRKAVLSALKGELLNLAKAMGSEISHQIIEKQKKSIYNHQLPKSRRYTRTHDLTKFTGHTVNTRTGLVVVFSTKVYAQYLERLVGKRWQTHWQKTDLKISLESMKMPTGRPYSNFIPGFIAGMKLIKRRFKYIKWAIN